MAIGTHKRDLVDLDLAQASLHRSFMHKPLGEGDRKADRIGVRCYREGVAYPLTDAVTTGYFIRADGTTVVFTGKISGNISYVSLPQSCYAVEGPFTLIIKCTMDGEVSTLRIVDGTVVKTTTETQVDPGTEIPDITTLLNKIAEMEEATAQAVAVSTCYADSYDAATAYDVGQYVTYGDPAALYRCTVAIPSPGEEFDEDHWASVTFGDDLYSYFRSIRSKLAPLSMPNNLLDPDECVDGYYVNYSTGELVADSGYFCSGLIPIGGNDTLVCSCGRNYALYDANQSYLSGVSGAISGPIRMSTNTRYIRITFNKLTDAIAPELAYIRRYGADASPANTQAQAMAVYGNQFPGNLVDLTDWYDNAYLTTSTWVTSTYEEGYFCTGYIPVTAGTVYKSNLGRRWAWYDSSYSVLAGYTGTDIQRGITAPSGAAYIRFTVNKTTDGISGPAGLYFTDIASFKPAQVSGVTPLWTAGKKICWLGDSIVNSISAGQEEFDEMVCDTLGLYHPVDDGIGGSTISLNGDGTDGRNAMCVRYTDMADDADIVAVSGGTNDWMYAWAPVGSMESTSNTTFYGALKNLCTGLIAKYPDKLIFFTTPIKRGQKFTVEAGDFDPDNPPAPEDIPWSTPDTTNKYHKTLGDYADIIKEVCGYYSIPVLDLYRESGLNPFLDAQLSYFDDLRTHPNADGQKIMARRVIGYLKSLGGDVIDL